jgi:hypothetical protein
MVGIRDIRISHHLEGKNRRENNLDQGFTCFGLVLKFFQSVALF